MAKQEDGAYLLELFAKNFGPNITVAELLKKYEQQDDVIMNIENAFKNKRYGNKNIQWEKLFMSAAGVFCAISPAAIKVFIILSFYASEQNGKTNVGTPRLQEITQMTRPTITKAIAECEQYALLSVKEGRGNNANTYWLNPEVVQIGKRSNSDLQNSIRNFYQSTGSTYEYVKNRLQCTEHSPAHQLFVETTVDFNNKYFRDTNILKENSTKIDDVVGIVSNTLEHIKLLEKQKKEAQKSRGKDLSAQIDGIDEFPFANSIADNSKNTTGKKKKRKETIDDNIPGQTGLSDNPEDPIPWQNRS